MRAFGLTDKGKVRKENQDSFQIVMIDEKSCLMAVLCDGMGGAAAGGVASGLAARVFSEFMSVRLRSSKAREDVVRMLHGALESANGIIYDYSCFDKAYLGMGTTLVTAVLRGSKEYRRQPGLLPVQEENRPADEGSFAGFRTG